VLTIRYLHIFFWFPFLYNLALIRITHVTVPVHNALCPHDTARHRTVPHCLAECIRRACAFCPHNLHHRDCGERLCTGYCGQLGQKNAKSKIPTFSIITRPSDTLNARNYRTKPTRNYYQTSLQFGHHVQSPMQP